MGSDQTALPPWDPPQWGVLGGAEAILVKNIDKLSAVHVSDSYRWELNQRASTALAQTTTATSSLAQSLRPIPGM